ncbi:MAG: SAM-dependent chlorinase/fluorinase [Bacteroidetes bacterium]|nr:SAM-dependent chlorinase/fluorinase [Bacteroidota bacterium]
MAIITLTSDWGTKDHYAGVVKGVILQQLPDATIIDISHEIPAFTLHHASFVVRNTYRYYPPGTVHIIDLNSDTPLKNKYSIVVKDGQYFIATDNGLFALTFEQGPDRILEIIVPDNLKNSTFIARDLFAPVACHLARGGSPDDVAVEKNRMDQKVSFIPTTEPNVIRGQVIYVDSYENVFTNISMALFEQVGRGRPFTIYFKTDDYYFPKINRYYGEVGEGDILAIFSTAGLLQIAINKGNAASLFNLHADAMVRVEFHD